LKDVAVVTSLEEARGPKAADLLKPGAWNRIRVEAKGDTFSV